MREIKFRHWDSVTKSMGYLWPFTTFEYIPANDDDIFIMQFTGLKDKAGKEIYEGDVVEFDNTRMQVVFLEKKCQFIFWQRGWAEVHYINSEAVIIGNIHQNPELVK